MAQYLGDFHKMFPQIATNYVRLQAGALCAKVNAERQAKQYLADVMQNNRHELRAGFPEATQGYVPCEIAGIGRLQARVHEAARKVCGPGVSSSLPGIAYNPNLVPADQAPKSWKDLLDPRWKDTINVKVSTSGLQHVTWYMIRQIYGDDYWKKFGELDPRAFDFRTCSSSTAR